VRAARQETEAAAALFKDAIEADRTADVCRCCALGCLQRRFGSLNR
jgi:hypothetical protein